MTTNCFIADVVGVGGLSSGLRFGAVWPVLVTYVLCNYDCNRCRGVSSLRQLLLLLLLSVIWVVSFPLSILVDLCLCRFLQQSGFGEETSLELRSRRIEGLVDGQ